MSKQKKIDEILISNFKFFPELKDSIKPIKIDGKHFLMYGENGSGKSSIFWALYTLLECANKPLKNEIQKYFKISSDKNLLNINAEPIAGEDKLDNAYVALKFKDDPNDKYKISFNDLSINENEEAQASNYASDFINYRFIYNAFNFRHRNKLDLYEHFKYSIFPYIKISACPIWKFNSQTNQWVDTTTENVDEVIDFLEKGPEYQNTHEGKKQYNNRRTRRREISLRINKALSELKKWEEYITARGNEILNNDFGYPEITFNVQMEVEKNYHITKRNYTAPIIHFWLIIKKYDGKNDKVHRLHSFLNEAKLTAISLAIRLAILEKRPTDAEVKILVLDDMMISLDMNNRDKVLKLIFDKYLKLYQLFILTHDRVFFEFVKLFIKQKSNFNDWCLSEMYVGSDGVSPKNIPIIINNEIDSIHKAVKYFQANDYVTCSLYIRKSIEKLILERLPKEHKKSIEGFHNVEHLWKLLIEYYGKLHHPISNSIQDSFVQTKLMVLNPQAHYNLSHPVYKIELENAFELIKKIEAECPISQYIILLTQGMKLEFLHPAAPYKFELELKTDFQIQKLGDVQIILMPKCKVISWNYNGVEFWSFRSNSASDQTTVNQIQSRDDKLDKIVSNLIKLPTLLITKDMFYENTKVINGLWSVKEILDKAGLTL